MRILAIETSCDETACAVLDADKRSIKVLSNVVSSQAKLHAKYGGVVPNLAAREHVKNIRHVFKLALKEAGVKNFEKEIDLIAVTRGPGLGPALLVGISFAKTLAWKYNKPIVGIDHMRGHIYSNWLSPTPPNKKSFPALNVVVSGGHTELVLMTDYEKFKLIGETLDDAIGEAFDKVARLLGFGYPGGPIISKLAEQGNPDRYPLPSPMIKLKNYNFSYSGLKTAVLYLVQDLGGKEKLSEQDKKDISASFQKAAISVLLYKTTRATKEYKAKSIMLSGGVSANKLLRSELEKTAKELSVQYYRPEMEYTTDNAAMIAVAGYFASQSKNVKSLNWKKVEMVANLGF